MPEEKKRRSKWDRGPESEKPEKSLHGDEKREKRSTKSKWDKLPEDSKWDKGPSKWDQAPSESKWDIRPEDVATQDHSSAGDSQTAASESKWDIRPEEVALQDHSSAGDSQTAVSTAGGCAIAAAAEAAARVNAMLMAKGTLKTAEPLLVNDTLLKAKPSLSSSAEASTVTSEVGINEVSVPCRNLLTRGVTQDDIFRATGASVTTKGRYMTAEEKMKCPGETPLHLLVQGPTQESVDKAVARIHEIINGPERTKSPWSSAAFSARPALAVNRPPQPLMSLNPNPTGLAYVQDKLFIGLEHSDPTFGVKDRILGPAGSYLTHIQMETGAKVFLRGKGSNFIEPTSGREAFEPMYIYIQHPTTLGLQQAKQLALNLINTVHEDYAQLKQSMAAMPPTVSPGTATMLAGLHHQQPPQFPPTYNPYATSLMPPSIPPPGLVSAGLPTMPPSFPGALPSATGNSRFQPALPLPVPHLRPPGFIQSWSSQSSTEYKPSTTLAKDQHYEPASSELYDPLEGTESDDEDNDIPTSSRSSACSTFFSRSSSGVSSVRSFAPVSSIPPVPPVVPSTQFPPRGIMPGMVPAPNLRGRLPIPVPGLPKSMLPSSVSIPPHVPPPQLPPSIRPLVQHFLPVTVPPPVVTQLPPTTTSIQPTNTATTHTSVTAADTNKSSSTSSVSKSESSKRRFTEEKEQDHVPDDLLGYRHGPLHLKHTLLFSAASSSPGHVTETGSSTPPPTSSSGKRPSSPSDHRLPTSPTSSQRRRDSRHSKSDIKHPSSNGSETHRSVTTTVDSFMPPPPPPPVTSIPKPAAVGSFAAPLVPVTQHVSGSIRKHASSSRKPTERKRLKGALVSVAMSYDSGSESDNSTD